MISEFTYEQAKDFTEVRELDLIRVVGKKKPVKIYELLGRKGEMNEKIREILPIFNDGLKYYKMRKWAEAIGCFEKAHSINENDGPSVTYFERCMLYENNPPVDDWDGVFAMTSK